MESSPPVAPGSNDVVPSIRVRVALFAVALAGLCVLALSVVLLVYAAENRAVTHLEIQKAAITIAQTIEREVAVTESFLMGLATSPLLQAGDLESFHRQARASGIARGSRILLHDFDAAGQRRALLNTDLAFGTPQPPQRTTESDHALDRFVREIMMTRGPRVLRVITSALTGDDITGIGVPVLKDGQARYALSAVLPLMDRSLAASAGSLPRQWFVGIVDQEGRYVAGHRAAEALPNLPEVDAGFRAEMFGVRSVFEGEAQDGRPLYVALSHSPKTDWFAVIAVPRHVLDAPWYRHLLIFAAVAGGLLLLAPVLGFVAAPRIALPLRRRMAAEEDRLRVVANAVPSMLFATDASGRCDYMSDAFYDYTGMAPGAADGFGWADALHPDDRARILAMLTQPREPQRESETTVVLRPDAGAGWLATRSTNDEIRLRSKDGGYRWFLVRVRIVRDAEGGPTRRFGSATDIDLLKQIEREVRRVSAELLKTQDDERRRIALEIHDTTLQDLVGAQLHLSQLRRPMAGTPGAAALDQALSVLEKAQRDLRTLSYLLHPPGLDELGLAAAIKWYAHGFEERSGIKTRVELPDDLPRLPAEVEKTLFRVVQEALVNVHRHSGSAVARIVIDRTPAGIALEVSDQGRGMRGFDAIGSDPGSAPLGVGIPGMRLRLHQIGGTLAVESGPGGVTLRATVPHPQAVAAD